MRTRRLLSGCLIAGVLCALPVHGQEIEVVPDAPVEAPAVVETVTPANAAAALAEIKASNARMLAQQQELLKKLEELEKQADQLRIFAKRG